MDDLAKAIGLEDQYPRTRSSDLKPQDEFLYMLTRRLGLVPKIQYRQALNRGGWFHRRCELFHCTGEQAHAALMPALIERNAELVTYAEAGGFDGQPLVDRETEDYDTAFSWYDAAAQVPLSTEDTICAGLKLKAGATFKDFILSPEWRILGTEVLISLEWAVIQIDLLIYSARTAKLWLVDMKTTAKAANDRLSSCPIESQTLMYPRVAQDALPMLIDKFDLAVTTTVGGMLHVAIQKPDIKMCGADRDFEWKDTFYKVNVKWKADEFAGPGDIKHKKGDFKSREKVWLSDTPRRSNFVARCADWYLGKGDYTDKAPDRIAHPTVAISSTPMSLILDDLHSGWFKRKFDRTFELARRPLTLRDFPPEESTTSWGSKTEKTYEPFYHLDTAYWPSIIEADFIVQDRDRDTPAPPSVTVLGANPFIRA